MNMKIFIIDNGELYADHRIIDKDFFTSNDDPTIIGFETEEEAQPFLKKVKEQYPEAFIDDIEIIGKKEKKIEYNGKYDGKCPNCGAAPLNLDPDMDHNMFDKHYVGFKQLIRCCSCQEKFIFRFTLTEVSL